MRVWLRLSSWLPLPLLHALGALLGELGLLRHRGRRRLVHNLTQARLMQPRTLHQAARELGKNFTELPLLWQAPLPRLFSHIRHIEGWEHVESAHAQGRGIVFLAPHLGCWEICGMYLASHMPCTALYTPPKQAAAHEVMRAGRERSGIRTVPPGTSGVRALLTRLKAGEAVFILPDQVANQGEGVWLRVLDNPVYMPVLPYRLLERTGAAPLLAFAERLPWARGYTLHIAPLPVVQGLEAQAQVIGDAMSALIRKHAGQYLWSYGLFRHRNYMPPMPEHLQ